MIETRGMAVSHPIFVWGVPLTPFTRAQAVEAVAALVRAGPPSYFITASTHYAMLTAEVAELRAVNENAAFVVADGKPLVWASRLLKTPLPERVAGSDMIFDLCELSAKEGFRVFFLGAPPGIADEAARRLSEKFPGLVVAGTECPPFRDLTLAEHEALIGRIRAARPDILFLAFGQPKGEIWLKDNLEALGVPVSVQIGASLDFASGRVRRAPKFLQKIGMEWAFRLALEPRRLLPRYAKNARFIASRLFRDLRHRSRGGPGRSLPF